MFKEYASDKDLLQNQQTQNITFRCNSINNQFVSNLAQNNTSSSFNGNRATIQHQMSLFSTKQQQQPLLNQQNQNLVFRCNSINNQFVSNPAQSNTSSSFNGNHATIQRQMSLFSTKQQQHPLLNQQNQNLAFQCNSANGQFVLNPAQNNTSSSFNGNQHTIQQQSMQSNGFNAVSSNQQRTNVQNFAAFDDEDDIRLDMHDTYPNDSSDDNNQFGTIQPSSNFVNFFDEEEDDETYSY